jgi:serine/threonine protein phosphatase PrpC
VTCGPSNTAALKLSSIQISFSSAYNTKAAPITLPAPIDVHCRQATTCSNGSALFSFNIDAPHPQPYIDLPSAAGDISQEAEIALTRSASSLDLPPAVNTDPGKMQPYTQQTIPQFLTPTRVPLSGGTFQSEGGTPLVNSSGQLTGLHLSGISPSLTAADIRTFLTAQPELKTFLQSPAPNPLHDNWDKGITAFYQKHYTDAISAFRLAEAANPEFQAARTLEQSTLTAISTSKGQTGSNVPASPGSLQLFGQNIPYWILSIVGLIVLVGILLLTSVIFGRGRVQRQRALKAEYAEAERRAAIDAQRIAEMEAAQQSWPPQAVPTQLSPSPVNTSERTAPLVSPELRCPRCGEPVLKDANYCSHCRLLLSPTDSGLHLRIPPQVASAQAPAASSSIADQPTIDMSPTMVGNGQTASETTVPYTVRQLQGHNLSFVVGTRSDPGIKRKYKPNEDSLFAAQGMSNGNQSPQQFGLFVVADGMGGHANGQDASRLAIQTIVDFLLPKLKHGDVGAGGFEQLLVEGVQKANQAVHHQNMEQRGDMGTTITATLIVATTAYVANVGDSRTYLYREGQGLSKITQDHSVVASLVEAGIIKPDDIYTHPKRNQIYRSLGEKPAVDIDSFTVPLQAGDKLLLCSDGLWDMVRDPQIEAVIKSPAPDPTMTGEALIQAALDGGGEDNVSVIVVQVTEASKRSGKASFQLLAKPDSVQMPPL